MRQQIERIHEEFPGYGCRRLVKELRRRGQKVGKKRIQRVMKKFGLQPITWRTFVRTTDSRHKLPVYPNRLKNRQVRTVNQVWVADITYIRIRSSFVYLAALLDLYSRRIVGWAISKRIDTELCLTALRMALKKRRARGCIHHSDRGVQYASSRYVHLLRQQVQRVVVHLATLTRTADAFDDLLAAERLGDPTALHDGQHCGLHGGEAAATLGARPTAPDRLALIGFA